MTLLTATQDVPLEIVNRNDVQDQLVEILDGSGGFLIPREDAAAPTATSGSGRFVRPGQEFVIEPRKDIAEFITAVGADLRLQVNQIGGQPGTGPDVRRVLPARQSGTGGLSSIARVQNTTPGANTDILSTDIAPPVTGNFAVKVELDGTSVFNVQETISGTTEAYDLNTGGALSADAGYSFPVPCRSDASYNFQVESNVTVAILQVDFTRDPVF